VDTTGRTIEDALDDVIVALRDSGHLDLTARPAASVVEEGALAPVSKPPLVEQRASTVEEGALAPVSSRPKAGAGDVVETPAADHGPAAPIDPPLRVLFVCTANICRSPFMELFSRHLVGKGSGIEFSSAGTRGFQDAEMSDDMVSTLTRRDVTDSLRFRSRPLTTEMVDQADLVLTAEAAHRQFILDDSVGSFRKVFTLGQFAEAVRGSDAALRRHGLLAAVAERRGNPDPVLDIPDPYGRGPEAAEACASSIEDLLRVALPALTGSRKITA
jgi:sulfate adenylyltransferase